MGRGQQDVRDIVVIDVGGTWTRAGVQGADLSVTDMLRLPSPNFMSGSGLPTLQSDLLDLISRSIGILRRTKARKSLDTIGIAFPGPTDREGKIMSAATLWGRAAKGIRFDLAAKIRERVPSLRHVFVQNDLSAGALRYAAATDHDRFCVMTVGSGISHKIYDRDRGGLLLGGRGLCGEIGHMKVDFSPDAPECDCGGRGHLGALSSGRAVERLARRMASAAGTRAVFAESQLWKLCSSRPEQIDNAMIAKAVKMGDAVARQILDRATFPLTSVIAQINVSFGIEKFFITGGFASALGVEYLASVERNLSKHDFDGRSDGYSDGLVEMGYDDDLDNLIGIGIHVRDRISCGGMDAPEAPGRPETMEATCRLERGYSNQFSRDILSATNPLLADLLSGARVGVYVDGKVSSLWGSAIRRYFETNRNAFADVYFVSLEMSESRKSLETVASVLEGAIGREMDRRAVLVAIGGGALMDTIGVAAQIFRRGIEYVRVPTTLLGLVDAAVGVKVGVNFGGHKNMVGGFYAPTAVVSDVGFLKTLDDRQLRSGIVEMIKIAVVSSLDLFSELEAHAVQLAAGGFEDPYSHESLITTAAVELLAHLRRDFYERDLERHVDFGHAFAHSFESASGYDLTHGEAVALDILMSAHIALGRGLLRMPDFERLCHLFEVLGLPRDHPSLTMQTAMEALDDLRQHKGGRLVVVVPESIGRTTFIDTLSMEELEGALSFVRSLAHPA